MEQAVTGSRLSLAAQDWSSQAGFPLGEGKAKIYNVSSGGFMVETWLGSQAAKVVTDIVAGKWKKHREVHDKVELHKRRILTSRIASNLYRELYGLRETFLEHNLMEKHDANRGFFDNWLANPVVEMGWSPAGGWTQERIAALRRDLKGVSG
jgi:hypothetical protein